MNVPKPSATIPWHAARGARPTGAPSATSWTAQAYDDDPQVQAARAKHDPFIPPELPPREPVADVFDIDPSLPGSNEVHRRIAEQGIEMDDPLTGGRSREHGQLH